MDNVLPERYLVQMVEYSSSPQVFRLLGPDVSAVERVQGQWTLKLDGDVTQLVVTVSGLTEFATEPAPFTDTLEKQ